LFKKASMELTEKSLIKSLIICLEVLLNIRYLTEVFIRKSFGINLLFQS
jgi:hypothetical protein